MKDDADNESEVLSSGSKLTQDEEVRLNKEADESMEVLTSYI